MSGQLVGQAEVLGIGRLKPRKLISQLSEGDLIAFCDARGLVPQCGDRVRARSAGPAASVS
ncbi:hypothetical protein [Microtetraspora malaysiensis]|uniref:hypothetical protein n=1 Tax=Microtetraspora malaysiensis TaxID=161358 RepID=UPI003D8C6004